MTDTMVRNRLKHFTEEEILLSDDEFKTVLGFFFEVSSLRHAIEQTELAHVHRSFSQALLVEGIDATYAMGFVEALVASLRGGRAVGAKTIIKKFAKKAAKHWFEHATLDELWDEDLEIYETVRRQIAVNHRTTAEGLFNGALDDY